MANYNSSYTGVQIDDAVARVITAKNTGGIVSGNTLSTTLLSYLLTSTASSTYLTLTNAASTYLTLSNATSTYLSKTDAANTYMLQTALLNKIYPIGAIYMSVDSTDPGTFIGGTWELIEDTFLLSAGTTYTAGDTGGEATHTMTVDEMPAHRHWISGAAYDDGNMSYSGSNSQDFGLAGDAGSYTQYDQCKSNGRYDAWCGGAAAGGASGKGTNSANGYTNTAHNNMPPYLVVYMWKRVA